MAKVTLGPMSPVTLGSLRLLARSHLPDDTRVGLLIVDEGPDAETFASETAIELIGTHLGRDDVGLILRVQRCDDDAAPELGQVLDDLAADS